MLPDVFEWLIAVDNWEANYGRTWRLEDAAAKLNEKYGTQLWLTFVGTDDRDLIHTSFMMRSYHTSFDNRLLSSLTSRCFLALSRLPRLHRTLCREACRAYEQFMIDLAKLIRTDRGLAINETRIREEVTRVMDLERNIANATDTPEDRNNPVLLYNKMELGDLNANFTLEVESQ
ncbi:neprilysin isoform X1, partial [Lates japonicus]